MGVLLMVLLMQPTAKADSFTFSFVSSTYSGSGFIQANQFVIPSIYIVSFISGSMNGLPLFVTPITQSVVYNVPGTNLFTLDPTGSGIYFTTSDGTSWAMFRFDNPVSDIIVKNAGGPVTQIYLSIVRVPEPSTLLLLGIGLLGLVGLFKNKLG
jgi:hypothetical protein